MTLFIINVDPTEEVASALFLRHHQLLYRNRGNDKHLPMLTANTFRISLKSSLSGPVSDKEHAKHTGYQRGFLAQI
ncbi:hypothetical protein ACU6N8_001618 [Yersinia enterocolitica]|nr:hypothetical protein [Yersinia enterocolitica]UXD31185.1 hypothetical protein FORC066_3981 [Yersinia enterocolitica]CNE53733.1 Uncharacterised protein [Yersinia enterocolitica]CQH22672.1 Uncharacterised protein [Yersinia enterocolitica]